MKTEDNLNLYRLNAAAEIKASRITNPTPLDAYTIEKNPLPTKPLDFESRVELYVYLKTLNAERLDLINKKCGGWRDELTKMDNKIKEIEQCLLEVVIMQKRATPILERATPILDAFNREVVSHEDEKRQLEIVGKYGSFYLTLGEFTNSVLLHVKGKTKTLPKLCKLVEHGLVIYDNDNPVSFPQLLASLEHRKNQCLIDADNLEFWDTLKNERNYQVKIDNVARAYYLAGNQTFDWYNWTIDKDVSIPIPDEIKADVMQIRTGNIEGNTKGNNIRQTSEIEKTNPYYTVNELAEKWNKLTDAIIKYGITGQLNFQALPDYKNNSTDKIERGGGSMSYPLSDRDLREIYYSSEPIIYPDCYFKKHSLDNGVNDLSWINEHDSYSIIIPNGIERLIIDAKEVERFENENGIEQSSAAKSQDDNKTKDKTNPKGKRNNQIDLICDIANKFNYDLLNIPEGGKGAIKTECLKNSIFTDSGFDHAWKEVNKRNLISMKDKEKYL